VRILKMRPAKLVFLILAAVLFSLILWAFVFEPASLRVSEYTIEVPGWPEEFPDLKVAVIADLHVGSPFIDIEKVNKVVDLTNAQSPDLILLPGDFVIKRVLGGKFVEPGETARVLSGLSAPLGVWGVLGNHDWWHNQVEVRDALESAGIPMLEDTAVPLRHNGVPFWLVGISDYYGGPHLVSQAFRDVPGSATFLAMTHTPDLFVEYPRKTGLLIASHTHGGQVYLPFLGRPIVPSIYGKRFASGLIVEEGRYMFVATGIGTSIIPVRFRVPPEISILNLR
jgi:predicted MPP superfamily phosphohydrolase